MMHIVIGFNTVTVLRVHVKS